MTEEIELSGKPSRYPKKAFDAVFEGYELVAVGQNRTPALQLNFEDEVQIALFGVHKVKDGKIPQGAGAYIDSLKALKIKSLGRVEGEILTEYRNNPELRGCKLYMKPLEEGQPTDSRSVFWGTVEKVDFPTTKASGSTVTRGPKPKLQAQIQEADRDSWVELLNELLPTEGLTSDEIIRAVARKIPDDKTREPYKISRVKTLAVLVEDGTLKLEGKKYSWA